MSEFRNNGGKKFRTSSDHVLVLCIFLNEIKFVYSFMFIGLDGKKSNSFL